MLTSTGMVGLACSTTMDLPKKKEKNKGPHRSEAQDLTNVVVDLTDWILKRIQEVSLFSGRQAPRIEYCQDLTSVDRDLARRVLKRQTQCSPFRNQSHRVNFVIRICFHAASIITAL